MFPLFPYLIFKSCLVLAYAGRYSKDAWPVLFNLLVSLPFAWFVLRNQLKNGKWIFIFVLDAVVPLVAIPFMGIWFLVDFLVRYTYKNPSAGDKFFNRSFEDYSVQLEGKMLKESETIKSGRLDRMFHDYVDLAPYANILQGNDSKLKINAIEKLSRIRSTEGIRLLKRALNDSTYEVSYFAKGALEEIENTVIRELEVIGRVLAKDPQSNALRLERGEKYLAFYNLEMLDEFTGRIFLEKALYDFSFTLQADVPPANAYLRIIEIHLHRKEFEQVVHYCQFYLGFEDREENASSRRNTVKQYLAQALYHLSDRTAFLLACRDAGATDGPFAFWKMSEGAR